MHTYTLSDVHKRHGEVFDRASVEPVIVTKQNRPSHVILGADLWSIPVEELFGKSALSVEEVAAAVASEAPVDKAEMAAAVSSTFGSGFFSAFLRHLGALRRSAEALQMVVSISDARRDFSAICNRVAFGKERVVIGRHGKNRVAVIPYEDLQLLEELEDRLDLRAALAALKEAEDEGTVAWDDAKRDLGL